MIGIICRDFFLHIVTCDCTANVWFLQVGPDVSIYAAVIDMKNKGLCPVIAFHLDTFMALSFFKELLKVIILHTELNRWMSAPIDFVPEGGDWGPVVWLSDLSLSPTHGSNRSDQRLLSVVGLAC